MANMDNLLRQTAYARVVQLRDEIREAISAKGLRASGRTQDSLRVYVDGNKVVLEGRAFFGALQYGSSPWSGHTGVRCSFGEFKGIIRDWARDKGLNFGQAKEHDRVVGAITASIIRKGSRLHRTGTYLNVYDTLIDEAIKDIGEQALMVQAREIDVIVDQWARWK